MKQADTACCATPCMMCENTTQLLHAAAAVVIIGCVYTLHTAMHPLTPPLREVLLAVGIWELCFGVLNEFLSQL